MSDTRFVERSLVTVLVAGVGLYELMHTIFDGMRFMTYVDFVGSVLSMEATPEPDSWRAIHSPSVAFIAYSMIWLAHALTGICCVVGACRLFGALKADSVAFSRAAFYATVGLGIGCIHYLIGFWAIAGEWFLLRMAPTPPNYVPNAIQLFMIYIAILIFLGGVKRS